MLYNDQGRYGDALPLIRRTIAHKTAATWAALPVLFGAQADKLIAADEAIDDGLNVVQRASQTSAGEALNALAVRFSAGSDRLAELVRKDQDLAGEAANLDKAIIAAVSKEPSKRDAAAEQGSGIASPRSPRNVTICKPCSRASFPTMRRCRTRTLTVKDIQALLADDEALVVVDLGDKKSYVWAITRSAASWKELAVTATEVSKAVSALRDLLNFHSAKPFDTQASFELYQEILAPVEDTAPRQTALEPRGQWRADKPAAAASGHRAIPPARRSRTWIG